MSSRLQWFVTHNGRTTMRILGTAIACGAFAINFLPQSIFLNQYKDFVTLRKSNEPVPISTQLTKLWNEVLDDLNFDKLQRINVQPFTVFGFDPWRAGSLKLKHGSIIGLPVNFTYTDVNSIQKDKILLHGQPIDWNSSDAEALLNNMILSDYAKKYAMAREILLTKNYNLVIQSLAHGLVISGIYTLAAQINDSFAMFHQTRMFRVLIYIAIITVFVTIWVTQRDFLSRYYESEVDNVLSALGKNYIKGGFEYYDKLLKRNIALRAILKGEGETTYTSKGNDYCFIRMKNLPFTNRKNFFEEKLRTQTLVIENVETNLVN